MEPLDYKPNSHKAKEEQRTTQAEKKVKKVVTSPAKTKENRARKFTSAFLPNDGRDVKTYAVHDVLIPGIKRAFWDILEMVVWGKESRKPKRSSTDYVSFSRTSDRRDDRYGSEQGNRTIYTYKDITLDSRGEAEEVLMQMDAVIEEYGAVSVADLYDMVDVSSSYTDNKYGWTNLRNAEVVRVRDGYLLKLPRAIVLPK